MKNAGLKKYIIPCIIILFFIIVIFFINKNMYEIHNNQKYNENSTKTQLITETGVMSQGEADNISVREIKAYTKGRRFAVFTEIELEPYSHNIKKFTSVIDDNDKVIAEYTWFNGHISSKKEENKLTQYVVDNNGNIAKIIITTYDVSYSNTIYELEYMYDVTYIPSGEIWLAKGFICNNKKYYFVRNDKNYISEITDEGGNVLLKYSYEGNALKHTEILDLQDNIVTLNPIVGEDFIYDDVTNLYFVHSSGICDFVNGGNFFEAEEDKNDTKSEYNSASHKMNYNIYTEKERQIIASSEKVKAKLIEEVSEDCNIYGIVDIKVRVEDIGGDELLAEYTIYKDDVEVCSIQSEEGVLISAGVDIFYVDITNDGERDIIIQLGEVGTFSAKWAFGHDLKNNTQIDIYKDRWELMEANKV